MKKLLVLLMSLAFAHYSAAQNVEDFVRTQLATYPASRLIDIYKSCFQDYMGAEHLVPDSERAKVYLDKELATTQAGELQSWYYEPCGINGRYVRISLKAVIEGRITKEQLLDAFIRSANDPDRHKVEDWRKHWKKIVRRIDKMKLSLPDYQADRQFIDNALKKGKYAISHSPEYREAYHPHYRIMKREIFENELKPMLEQTFDTK